MRIVLDTNVALSALLWRGTPYRLFEAMRQRQDIQLITSAVLLEELADVLLRPVGTKRLGIIACTAHQIMGDYIDVTNIVTPLATPRVISDDPDDDHVIAAAVAGRADIIVSGDRHLLTLKTHKAIRILTPAEALAIIGQ